MNSLGLSCFAVGVMDHCFTAWSHIATWLKDREDGKGTGLLSQPHLPSSMWLSRVPIFSIECVVWTKCIYGALIKVCCDLCFIRMYILIQFLLLFLPKRKWVAVWLGCRCGTCHCWTVFLKLELGRNERLSRLSPKQEVRALPFAYIQQKCICWLYSLLTLLLVVFVSKLSVLGNRKLLCRITRHYGFFT